MNTKKLVSVIIVAVAVVIGIIILVSKLNNKNGMMNSAVPTPTPELKFEVVRVLPSGFSPKEVTIEKGMILRFTNPLESKVSIKWDEDQYTTDNVYLGHDIATKIFDKAGTYTFSDQGNPTHQGKVTVK